MRERKASIRDTVPVAGRRLKRGESYVTGANKGQKCAKPEISRETSAGALPEEMEGGRDRMRKSNVGIRVSIRGMRLSLLEKR